MHEMLKIEKMKTKKTSFENGFDSENIEVVDFFKIIFYIIFSHSIKSYWYIGMGYE